MPELEIPQNGCNYLHLIILTYLLIRRRFFRRQWLVQMLRSEGGHLCNLCWRQIHNVSAWNSFGCDVALHFVRSFLFRALHVCIRLCLLFSNMPHAFAKPAINIRPLNSYVASWVTTFWASTPMSCRSRNSCESTLAVRCAIIARTRTRHLFAFHNFVMLC